MPHRETNNQTAEGVEKRNEEAKEEKKGDHPNNDSIKSFNDKNGGASSDDTGKSPTIKDECFPLFPGSAMYGASNETSWVDIQTSSNPRLLEDLSEILDNRSLANTEEMCYDKALQQILPVPQDSVKKTKSFSDNSFSQIDFNTSLYDIANTQARKDEESNEDRSSPGHVNDLTDKLLVYGSHAKIQECSNEISRNLHSDRAPGMVEIVKSRNDHALIAKVLNREEMREIDLNLSIQQQLFMENTAVGIDRKTCMDSGGGDKRLVPGSSEKELSRKRSDQATKTKSKTRRQILWKDKFWQGKATRMPKKFRRSFSAPVGDQGRSKSDKYVAVMQNHSLISCRFSVAVCSQKCQIGEFDVTKRGVGVGDGNSGREKPSSSVTKVLGVSQVDENFEATNILRKEIDRATKHGKSHPLPDDGNEGKKPVIVSENAGPDGQQILSDSTFPQDEHSGLVGAVERKSTQEDLDITGSQCPNLVKNYHLIFENMHIVGDAGSGKTTALEWYLSTIPDITAERSIMLALLGIDAAFGTGYRPVSSFFSEMKLKNLVQWSMSEVVKQGDVMESMRRYTLESAATPLTLWLTICDGEYFSCLLREVHSSEKIILSLNLVKPFCKQFDLSIVGSLLKFIRSEQTDAANLSSVSELYINEFGAQRSASQHPFVNTRFLLASFRWVITDFFAPDLLINASGTYLAKFQALEDLVENSNAALNAQKSFEVFNVLSTGVRWNKDLEKECFLVESVSEDLIGQVLAEIFAWKWDIHAAKKLKNMENMFMQLHSQNVKRRGQQSRNWEIEGINISLTSFCEKLLPSHKHSFISSQLKELIYQMESRLRLMENFIINQEQRGNKHAFSLDRKENVRDPSLKFSTKALENSDNNTKVPADGLGSLKYYPVPCNFSSLGNNKCHLEEAEVESSRCQMEKVEENNLHKGIVESFAPKLHVSFVLVCTPSLKLLGNVIAHLSLWSSFHFSQNGRQCGLESKQLDRPWLGKNFASNYYNDNCTFATKKYVKDGMVSIDPGEISSTDHWWHPHSGVPSRMATVRVMSEEPTFIVCRKNLVLRQVEESMGMSRNPLLQWMGFGKDRTDQLYRARKKIASVQFKIDDLRRVAVIPHDINDTLQGIQPPWTTLSEETGPSSEVEKPGVYSFLYCVFDRETTLGFCIIRYTLHSSKQDEIRFGSKCGKMIAKPVVDFCYTKCSMKLDCSHKWEAFQLFQEEMSQDNYTQMENISSDTYFDIEITSRLLKSDNFLLDLEFNCTHEASETFAGSYQGSAETTAPFIATALQHIHKDLMPKEPAFSHGNTNAMEKLSYGNFCGLESCMLKEIADQSALGYFGVEMHKRDALIDNEHIQAFNLDQESQEKFDISLKDRNFDQALQAALSFGAVRLISNVIFTNKFRELAPGTGNPDMNPETHNECLTTALIERSPTFENYELESDDEPSSRDDSLNNDHDGIAEKMHLAPETSDGEDQLAEMENANEELENTRAFPDDVDEIAILKGHDRIPKISDIYKLEAIFRWSCSEFGIFHLLHEHGTNEKRNCSPPNSRMNEESARRSSFLNRRNHRFNADDFAVAGFYLSHDDVIACYSCNIEHQIDEIDSAPATSRWHRPECQYLANIRSNPTTHTQSDGRVSDDIADPPGQQSIYIPPGDIRREAYRLSTFEQFPVTCAISRKSLAKSGFYFTGFYDRVKCFACARTVERWEEIDNPAELKWHKTACPLPRGEECGNIPIPSLFQAIAPAIQAATATTPAPAPGSSTSSSQPANQAGTTQSGERILEQRDPNTGAIIRRVRYPADLPERIRQTGGTFEIGPNNEVIIRSGPGPGQQNPANVGTGAQSQPRRQWRMANVISADHKRFLTNLFLNRELDRLASFARWPVTRPNIAPAYLAKSGFFYLGDMDRTQCFSCGGVLRNWKVDDDAAAEHRTHFPQCRMVLGVEPRNIPLHEHPETEEEKEERYPCRFPSNPHMRSEQARLGTFDRRWPMGRTAATPAEIAQGGFFFLGERDRAKCWYCNGGLQNWEYDDIPWIEHAKWFPNCQFLLRVKGQHFVYRHLALNPHLARPIIARQDGSPFESVGQPAQAPRPQDIPPREQAARQPTPPPTIIDPQEEMRKRKERVQNIMRNSDLVKNVLAMGFDDKIVAALLEDKINSGNEANSSDIYGSASQLLDDVFKKEEEVRKANEERSRQSSATAQPPSLPGPASMGTASSMYSISGMSGMSSLGPPPGSGKYNVSYYDDEGEDERMDQDMYGSMEGTSASITSVTAAKRLQGAEENPESLREALNKIEEERMCKICFTNQADMVFVPCSHMCCCMECTQAIRQCPVCRKKIDKAIKTYLN